MFKKRYFKIPFINKYLILGDGYPEDFDLSHTTFIEFLDNYRFEYSTGVWIPNIDAIIGDIEYYYEFYHTGEKLNEI